MISNAGLREKIAASFPSHSDGSAMKELRRLIEIDSDNSSVLDQVVGWRDLVEILREAASTQALPGLLMFLQGPGWRDLLPAWMTASLDSGLGRDELGNLLAPIVCSLDPQVSAEISGPEIFEERTLGLTDAQREAIAGFVAWVMASPVVRDDPKSKPQTARLRLEWPLRSAIETH